MDDDGRKKCGEESPICGECARLNLPCIPRNSAKATSDVPEASNEKSLPPAATHESPEVIKADTTPNSTDDAASSGRTDDQVSLEFTDWVALIDGEASSGLRERAHLGHSSALKVLPEARASDEDPAPVGTVPPVTLDYFSDFTTEALKDWTVGEKHLLNHYLQVVSRALVVVPDDVNPFLRVLIPMAFESTTVRHALIALSACHLYKVYPDFQRNLLFHRSMTLQGLKSDLDDPGSGPYSLAATLLLCLLEICDGTSRNWILHLHGAKALLANSPNHDPDVRSEFFTDLYDYLCCITAITSHRVPVRRSPRCISRESAHGKRGRTSIHPLYGVGEDIYRLITQINEWIRGYVALGSAAAMDESLKHNALELDQRLRRWTLNDDCIFDKELRELSAAADALRWAAVMRLSQATRRNPVPEAPTTLEVDKILSAMSQIRPGSHVETQLVFPLFMAGASSPDKASRLTVEYRLNVIECTKGFGNIVCAHKLLDEVWARANERQAVHWEVVMHQQFPDLVLL
ncbi:hypothetical protein LTR84_012367 [Exophiala bonariae]|uniref:Zn(2)-C6 fungal-type domain-containing protein n=1 Tax=Exophiala bonariae TaxID=1690606 RepID=A0AAV9NG60_9EURO|nr:hypothetical protein LTR84_012367 [Exophiala bonariae]